MFCRFNNCGYVFHFLFYRSHYSQLDGCANKPTVIVGNKCDLLEGNAREVTQAEVENFTREINPKCLQDKVGRIQCFETSCKTGESVKEMFEYVFELSLLHKGYEQGKNS